MKKILIVIFLLLIMGIIITVGKVNAEDVSKPTLISFLGKGDNGGYIYFKMRTGGITYTAPIAFIADGNGKVTGDIKLYYRPDINNPNDYTKAKIYVDSGGTKQIYNKAVDNWGIVLNFEKEYLSSYTGNKGIIPSREVPQGEAYWGGETTKNGNYWIQSTFLNIGNAEIGRCSLLGKQVSFASVDGSGKYVPFRLIPNEEEACGTGKVFTELLMTSGAIAQQNQQKRLKIAPFKFNFIAKNKDGVVPNDSDNVDGLWFDHAFDLSGSNDQHLSQILVGPPSGPFGLLGTSWSYQWGEATVVKTENLIPDFSIMNEDIAISFTLVSLELNQEELPVCTTSNKDNLITINTLDRVGTLPIYMYTQFNDQPAIYVAKTQRFFEEITKPNTTGMPSTPGRYYLYWDGKEGASRRYYLSPESDFSKEYFNSSNLNYLIRFNNINDRGVATSYELYPQVSVEIQSLKNQPEGTTLQAWFMIGGYDLNDTTKTYQCGDRLILKVTKDGTIEDATASGSVVKPPELSSTTLAVMKTAVELCNTIPEKDPSDPPEKDYRQKCMACYGEEMPPSPPDDATQAEKESYALAMTAFYSKLKIWTGVGCISVNFSSMVTDVLRVLGGIMGLFIIYCITWNGIKVMSSRGNPEALKKAQEDITGCVVGFLVLMLSVIILQIIGVDILALPFLSKGSL